VQRPPTNDLPSSNPAMTKWVSDLRGTLSSDQVARLELMTAGKTDAEIHGMFGGDPAVALARINGSNLPNDLIQLRASLSDDARRAFDFKWNQMLGDARNPASSKVNAFRRYLDGMRARGGDNLEAGLIADGEKIPPGNVPEPRMADFPESWSKFDTSGNEAFKAKLEELRGTADLDTKFAGGEGMVFRIDGSRAIKRWYSTRLQDLETSLALLRDSRAAVDADSTLGEHVSVVTIHEQGPDWIVRDWLDDSTPLNKAPPEAEVARLAAIAHLEGKARTAIENEILKKLKNSSDNLHWSPSVGKIVIIDMM
jgi:hypothetical protein